MHRTRSAGPAYAAVVLAVVLAVGSSAPAAADEPPRFSHAFSSGTAHDARLTIPTLPRVHHLQVVAYYGRTDDARGTRIQNRGIAASSHGKHGGTGPGGLGNYQVTGHRTSHGGIFGRTPSLDHGDKVFVDAGRWRYVYRIIKTRWTSFRSATSLRAQRAAVPGRPGVAPRHGYITISTCATPEDHARGNYWTDRFGNPEHRIDKIGVLERRVHRPGTKHR
ncbi:sortase [Nocardioides sp. MAH-18]|uniref:Sortase n=1 Tax=Nocardioides agri TaxID=2682843 RepID=A0A6L6XWN1_9ACTN|nr:MULTISPECIES: sortase [unclassified Nocardioides]MBA2952642.1 sortase [Nocardioides sp. CGMCC 1.13656]MVQ51804.1 sortase [Nocardioides sp. MAH-18]